MNALLGRPVSTSSEIGSRNKVGGFVGLPVHLLLASQPHQASRMWVAGLSVSLLPICLSTTFFHKPFFYPFPRLPMLMAPSLHPKMGNRPFDKTIERKSSGYHTCQDHTAEWHEWESGSTGTIKVKRNGSRLAAAPWDLKMVFTHPVSLQVINRTQIRGNFSRCRCTTGWLMSSLGRSSMLLLLRGVSGEVRQARKTESVSKSPFRQLGGPG